MTLQRQTPPGRHEHVASWTVAQIRADLADMPADKRAEAIARARELAERRPGSYLARNFARLYGETE